MSGDVARRGAVPKKEPGEKQKRKEKGRGGASAAAGFRTIELRVK